MWERAKKSTLALSYVVATWEHISTFVIWIVLEFQFHQNPLTNQSPIEHLLLR